VQVRKKEGNLMRIDVLLTALEEARRRYNTAKDDVERIRNQIAEPVLALIQRILRSQPATIV